MTQSPRRKPPHLFTSVFAAFGFIVVLGVSQSGEGFAADVSIEITELNDPGAALEPADRLSLAEQPVVDGPVVDEPPEGLLIFPLEPETDCYILDNFGDARGSSRLHEGVDILGSAGQPVYAVAGGVLTNRYTNTGTAGWGWTLYDEATNTTYKYFHLMEDANEHVEDDVVELGEIIGYVGDTGTSEGNFHLHFEVRLGEGSGTTAIDPLPLLHIDTEMCGVSSPLRA